MIITRRGEQELECLNKVKKHPFNSCNCYFMDESEIELINEIINSVNEQEDKNMFPDFICSDGFIEVFKITSSKETKKGSQRNKEFAEHSESLIKEVKEELRKGNFPVATSRFEEPQHSHENLMCSFERNFKNHLENYKRELVRERALGISIFMIDYDDFGLVMLEDYSNCEELLLKKNSSPDFCNYLLSKDKNLLNKIQEYLDEVGIGLDYIIFAGIDNVEIIKISAIRQIIESHPIDYLIEPINSFTISTMIGV